MAIGTYLKGLMGFLGARITRSVLKSDSSAGRGMIARLGVGKKAKHIDVQFMFAQEAIRRGEWELQAVPGDDNVADLGTKYVKAVVMKKLLRMLNIETSSFDFSSVGS